MQRLLALQCRKHNLVLRLAVCPVDTPQEVEPTIQLLQGMGAVTKYSCSCSINVWGKPALRLQCLECGDVFEPAMSPEN